MLYGELFNGKEIHNKWTGKQQIAQLKNIATDLFTVKSQNIFS